MGVEEDDTPQVDLTAERWQVRQESRRNLFTGKTVNSVENVAQFFKERGINVPGRMPMQAPVQPVPNAAAPAVPRRTRRLSCLKRLRRQAGLGKQVQ